jgi:hypothetical protein
MPESDARNGVTIAIGKLIVELENVFLWIESRGPIGVHRQVSHGLVGKEVRRVRQGKETLDAQAPIELPKQQKKSGIHRIPGLSIIPEEALVAGKTAVGLVKRGDIVSIEVGIEIVPARKKPDIGIAVKDWRVDRQGHDEGQLATGRMAAEVGIQFVGKVFG